MKRGNFLSSFQEYRQRRRKLQKQKLKHKIRQKIMNKEVLPLVKKGAYTGSFLVRRNDFYRPYQICDDLMEKTKDKILFMYFNERKYYLYWVLHWEIPKRPKKK